MFFEWKWQAFPNDPGLWPDRRVLVKLQQGVLAWFLPIGLRRNLRLETRMEWVEIIRLVSAPQDVNVLQESIRAQVNGLKKTQGLKRALVMLHAMYGTDFAVVLVWENDRQPVKTREGLLLADCLQQYGSVDHAVWTVL
jgi:hypothetical protein